MQCSNVPHSFSLTFTQADLDEINDKCGLVTFWALKQTGPTEFMLEGAAEGEGVRILKYGGSDGHVAVARLTKVPKTLANRHWGLMPVAEFTVVRAGVKFTPDMSKTYVPRKTMTQAERVHDRAEALAVKDTGALMSLREFTTSVDKVNKFVTENAGNVVLEVRGGLLKFLVEG